MKNLKYLMILVLCISISGCIDGQIRKTVYGNKNVVKKERSTEAFTGIEVGSNIDAFLSQGDKISVEVEADENLHEYIKTEVKNGILNVYTDVNIREAEKKRVNVTMKDITSLRCTSAGDLLGMTPLKSEDLRISCTSAGDIKVEAYTKTVDIDISSSGDLSLTGEAEKMNADLSSAGDLNAYEFKVKEADISVSSAGDADIFVTEKLRADASSAGDVNYKGDPKNVDAHTSSAGGVNKK